MLRIPRQRQRPWALWCAPLLVCILLAQGQARLLVKQNDESLGVSEVSSSTLETTGWRSQTESTPVLVVGSHIMSPFYWFQQQLTILAALERAMMERLNEGIVTKDAADSFSSQEDLLRNVGCARMRAALLNKVAQQGSEVLTGTSVSDSSAGTTSSVNSNTYGRSSTSSSYIPNVMDDNVEEYFEDSGRGSVSSHVAYMGSADSSRLRAEGGDAEGLAAGDSSDEAAAASLMTSRALQADGYYDYPYLIPDAEESMKATDVTQIEYYDSGYEEYEEEEEDEEWGEEEEEEEKEEEEVEEPLPYAQDSGQVESLPLLQQYSLEGRILKLLEGIYIMAFGGGDDEEFRNQEGQDQLVAAAAATDDVDGLAVAAGALTTTATDADVGPSVEAVSTAAGTTAAGDVVYDSYMLEQRDMMYGIDSDDNEGDQSTYDIYDDYYQAISLADTMLSRLDLDSEEDAWADYLEQAYEYFAYYNDDDWYKFDGMYDEYDPSIWDASSALAALANIAELVLWAHTGDIVLEVRPGITVSHVFEDDGTVVESGSVFMVARNPYSGDSDVGYTATIYGIVPDEVVSEQLLLAETQQQAPLELVNDMNMQLVFSDGSVNWGLLSMLILVAGTLAMLVGFVASWISLRRSMALSSLGLVYVPPHRAGKQQGCSGWGSCGGRRDLSGKGGKAAPLLLQPDDIKGAVCWTSTPVVASAVEDASQYVSPKVENESVAKALYK
ncbi:hypothetical protein Vafri_1218 [Volvox africanus]|nr:hypothetical protein Vafri_1218 [Volvox africanus]